MGYPLELSIYFSFMFQVKVKKMLCLVCSDSYFAINNSDKSLWVHFSILYFLLLLAAPLYAGSFKVCTSVKSLAPVLIPLNTFIFS